MQRHRALQSGALYALPLDSPIPAFDRYRINALLRVAAHSPDRGRMLVTAFRSPATSFAFANAIPGSKLPTCYFASQPPNSTARSAFPLHYRNRFAPIPAASLLLARCSLTCRLDWLPFRLPLPLGTLTSLRIEAFGWNAADQPAFRFRPISSRSPLPFSIASVSATDHRSWFATFSKARCSSNLLEPPSICARARNWSTAFCTQTGLFHDNYLACFELVTVKPPCISCG